jgi:hypothetical protein
LKPLKNGDGVLVQIVFHRGYCCFLLCLTFSSLSDFSQYADIVLVSRVIDPALDAQQTVQVNPVDVAFAVFSTNAVFPGRSESGAFDCPQKVYAIRGDTQLENLLINVRIQEMWTAKVNECGIGAFDIVSTGINPFVHILRVAWFCMIDESKATNNQVPDTVLTENVKQVFKILNGLHRS